jgi:NAD(P)-dependent dehydrogenase (short-subunit alcohol dehydrogenase family)
LSRAELGVNVNFDLKGKAALITGGASGFGSAIASALVEEGCIVYLADINLPAAERAMRTLGEERMPSKWM